MHIFVPFDGRTQTHRAARRSDTHLFNGGHLDRLVVVQRCVGRVHVVAETGHRHLVTVMQCHRYSNCSQSWNVLELNKQMQAIRTSAHTHRGHLLIQSVIHTNAGIRVDKRMCWITNFRPF